MATERQQLGEWGEKLVLGACNCPSCKRTSTLRQLPNNFKCADLICDFCGYLAQVKSANVADETKMPKSIMGAAWGPQSERMNAGIYFPLFVVLKRKTTNDWTIYFLPADLQTPEMFKARKPLSENARRAGWQGYLIDCHSVRDRFVRLESSNSEFSMPPVGPAQPSKVGSWKDDAPRPQTRNEKSWPQKRCGQT